MQESVMGVHTNAYFNYTENANCFLYVVCDCCFVCFYTCTYSTWMGVLYVRMYVSRICKVCV